MQDTGSMSTLARTLPSHRGFTLWVLLPQSTLPHPNNTAPHLVDLPLLVISTNHLTHRKSIPSIRLVAIPILFE